MRLILLREGCLLIVNFRYEFITKSQVYLAGPLYEAPSSPYLDLDERSNISLVCNCEIVRDAEQNGSTEDQHAIVHGHRSSWCYRWPETEEDDQDHKQTGDNIICNAP